MPNTHNTPGALPIDPDNRLKLLKDQDVEKIHRATVTILEEIGIKVPSEKALKIYADAGAIVDFENQIVKIPENILMDAISKAKRPVVMASRGSDALDLILDGKNTYMGTDGCGTTVRDLETREKRPSQKSDIAMMAKIVDHLHSISFFWPPVSAQDTPTQTMPLHEIEAAFNNTEKHVTIITCADPDTARYAVQMADAVCGGDKERMRNRPPLSILSCPLSPLCQDADALEASLIFAEAGLPVGFATMPTLGATSPASVASMLAQGNAELLSAICYVQLVHPGTPVFYAFYSTMMNPYTGGTTSAYPTQFLMNSGVIQIGQYYKLPVLCGWGTDGGMEFNLDASFQMSIGSEMNNTFGALLEEVTLLEPESLVRDTDLFDSLKTIKDGIQVDDESLALDEIKEVGHGGHFLSRRFTMDNMRKIAQQGASFKWDMATGEFKDPTEVAIEKTKWILENHKPVPLDESVKQKLVEIIKTAEKEIIK